MTFLDQWIGRVWQGDCMEFMARLSSGSVDLALMDPDYGVGVPYGGALVGSAAADALLLEALRELHRICPTVISFWSGKPERLAAFMGVAAQAGWTVRHIGIWRKLSMPGASGNGIARRWEPWFWLNNDTARPDGEWRVLTDIISGDPFRDHNADLDCPGQKPYAVLAPLLAFFSRPGTLVFDPFLGSGSLGVAAERLGRRWCGCELDPVRARLAEARIARERVQQKLPMEVA